MRTAVDSSVILDVITDDSEWAEASEAALKEAFSLGPLIVGGSFFRVNQTGDIPGGVDAGSGATITSAGLTTGQQQSTGVAAGGTFTLVPGVSLFVDYLWGFRQQGGYDFSTGNAGTANNYVQAQLFGVGTQIQW